MKIEVTGFSGSGKSTLARKLGEIYNLPVLHVDTLHFEPNWVVRDNELLDKDLEEFIHTNDSWVIDGNYYRHVPERFDEADYIINLSFSPLTCLKRVHSRIKKYEGIQRDDQAIGCFDHPSLSFDLWVVFGSRGRKVVNRFKAIQKKYPDKIIQLKNQKQVDAFITRLVNHEPIGKN